MQSLLLPEDSYGTQKRVNYISDFIIRYHINFIIDIGCGTGRHLTYPLSILHPKSAFFGYDRDQKSITNSLAQPNICYSSNPLSIPNQCDLLILSEVLEHIYEPTSFLLNLLHRTRPKYVFISVPNGFGPFEFSSFLRRKFFRYIALPPPSLDPSALIPSTYDNSPHVNFFTHKSLYRIFSSCSLSPISYSNRTFLCGMGFDYFVRKLNLQLFNSMVADYLPHYLVSDWMFFLQSQ